MALAGPIGRDLGIFFALSTLDDKQAAQQILEAMDAVWEQYSKTLRTEGNNKSDAFLEYVFKDVIGWTGWFMMLANYMFPCHTQFVPFDSEESKEVYVLGVSRRRLGFEVLRSRQRTTTKRYVSQAAPRHFSKSHCQ